MGIEAAIIGGSLIGAGSSIVGAKTAAKASKRATNSAVGESRRQFDLTRGDLLPFIQTGHGALAKLASLYGIGGGNVIEGDFERLPFPGGRFRGRDGSDIGLPVRRGVAVDSSQPSGLGEFFASPDFQFNLEQGQKAIDRSLAARGKALSGQGVREGVRFASGIASREFGSFFDRLATLAGIGNTGAAQSAAAGSTSASQIGGAFLANGQTQANARMSAASGANSALQGGISNLLLLRMLGNGGAAA